jgi:diguanylate cyclase (GGDEF)-like protein
MLTAGAQSTPAPRRLPTDFPDARGIASALSPCTFSRRSGLATASDVRRGGRRLLDMSLTTVHDPVAVPVPRSPAWTGTLVAAALLLVFVVDRATGSAPVQHLYYLPIFLAGRRLGMRGGVIAALAAIVLYHAANARLLTFRYGESDVVQIALFLLVGVITARMTDDAERLRHLALTDDLTGLHNLRSFQAHLSILLRESCDTNESLALLALDLDRLKSLNDTYGHSTGADAVRTVGHILAAHLPPEAVACRYGGDEFAVVIPRCTRLVAHVVAADLCHAVYGAAPMLAGREFPAATLSISVGVACSSSDRDAPEQAASARDDKTGDVLFHEADAALYRAKALGRNRVWVA